MTNEIDQRVAKYKAALELEAGRTPLTEPKPETPAALRQNARDAYNTIAKIIENSLGQEQEHLSAYFTVDDVMQPKLTIRYTDGGAIEGLGHPMLNEIIALSDGDLQIDPTCTHGHTIRTTESLPPEIAHHAMLQPIEACLMKRAKNEVERNHIVRVFNGAYATLAKPHRRVSAATAQGHAAAPPQKGTVDFPDSGFH